MPRRKLKNRLLQLIVLLRNRQKRKDRQARPRKYWVNPAYLKRVPDEEFHRIYLPMKRLAETGDDLSIYTLIQQMKQSKSEIL
jgi:hypothetical protein